MSGATPPVARVWSHVRGGTAAFFSREDRSGVKARVRKVKLVSQERGRACRLSETHPTTTRLEGNRFRHVSVMCCLPDVHAAGEVLS